MNEVLVSIIIPTYNRAETIQATINSALNQSYSKIEVIIVDDASNDDTPEIVSTIKDSRVRYIRNSKNKGANISRNIGIANAKGEFIAFLDSADIWNNQKIEKQLRYIQTNKDVDIVFCAELVHIDDREYMIPHKAQRVAILQGKTEELLAAGNLVDTSAIFCKKSCFNLIGEFDPQLPRWQDYEWILRAIQRCNIGYLDEALVDSYIREDSISFDIKKIIRAVPLIYAKHHAFFSRHQTDEGILLYPIKELHKNDAPFSYYTEYFDLLSENLSENMECDLNRLYVSFIEYFYQENRKFKCKIQNIESGFELPNLIQEGIEFNIFGAGEVAEKTYRMLQKEKKEHLVRHFIVTDKVNNQSPDNSISLLEMRECGDVIKNMPIVVAVAEEKVFSVMTVLEVMQFSNIVIL